MSELQYCEYGPLTNARFVKENPDPKLYHILTRKNLQAKNLIILLHGYGSNGENLLSLAPEYAKLMPNSIFVSPNGIEHWDGGFPNSYQWFSLREGIDGNQQELAAKIRHSNQVLKAFIEGQMKKHEVGYENLMLIGFSQGAMMACYQAMIAPKKVASVISYSGKIIMPQNMGDELVSKPKICLIHGRDDSVLPFAHFEEAKKILNEHRVPYEAHAFDDLNHAIDYRAIEAGKIFIQRTLS